jgi:hypothetical protein
MLTLLYIFSLFKLVCTAPTSEWYKELHPIMIPECGRDTVNTRFNGNSTNQANSRRF